MLAQNSQGLSVSAVPTAAEVEDLPQPQHYGYKSQGAAVNEEACRYEEEQQQEEEGEEEEEECIREEGGIEEAVSIMKVESTTDEKKPLNTSDLALESVEKYEVCMNSGSCRLLSTDSWSSNSAFMALLTAGIITILPAMPTL